MGGPKTKRGADPAFAARIRWLRQHGVIADEHAHRWDGFRELRNDTSDPKMQSIFTPGNAYTVLSAVAECVSGLYAPPTLRTTR
jgi:hypothetical protein